MKTLLSLLALLNIVTVSYSQNVGISINAPTEKLHVDSGNIKIGNSVWFSSTNDKFLKFGDGNFARLGEANADDYLYFYSKNFVFMPSDAGYLGNIGIANPNPTEKLDVTGNIKVSGSATVNNLKITTLANPIDFLRSAAGGQVTSVKGYNALGINYIISLCGIYPSQGSACGNYGDAMIGEVRMFAGTYAPSGWAFCNGQLLPISSYNALFSILGTTYGGNGISTFALPDLKAAVPVHPGSSGSTWSLGERTN
ncbi:MAG: tail fiber protein [Ferruginibacter sp.]